MTAKQATTFRLQDGRRNETMRSALRSHLSSNLGAVSIVFLILVIAHSNYTCLWDWRWWTRSSIQLIWVWFYVIWNRKVKQTVFVVCRGFNPVKGFDGASVRLQPFGCFTQLQRQTEKQMRKYSHFFHLSSVRRLMGKVATFSFFKRKKMKL